MLAFTIFIIFLALVFIGITAIDIAGYFRQSVVHRPAREYMPKVLVIVPCRDKDLTLYQNLIAFKSQSYKKYDLVAVVDTESDAAVPELKKARIRYLLSKAKCTRCSGKVRAVSTALEESRNYDVYVVADSDILTKSNWLSDLVSGLSDKRVGIATTFPFFNPVGGFWSKVKMIWGFVGDGLLETKATRFGWGGSLAFKKEVLGDNGITMLKDSWFSVSDDIALTNLCWRKGLDISYVKSAKPIINSDDSLHVLWEWSNRQTALTLLGYRRNLYYGLAFYGAEILLFISGIALMIWISPLAIVLLAHYVQSLARNYARSGRAYASIILITAMMPFLYTINLLVASGKKTIDWRGRRYKLYNS